MAKKYKEKQVVDSVLDYYKWPRVSKAADEQTYVDDGTYYIVVNHIGTNLQLYTYPSKNSAWNDRRAKELLKERGFFPLSERPGAAPTIPGDTLPEIPPDSGAGKRSLIPGLPQISPWMLLAGIGLIAAVLVMKK